MFSSHCVFFVMYGQVLFFFFFGVFMDRDEVNLSSDLIILWEQVQASRGVKVYCFRINFGYGLDYD